MTTGRSIVQSVFMDPGSRGPGSGPLGQDDKG